MANTLNVFRNGAVGFIDWLDFFWRDVAKIWLSHLPKTCKEKSEQQQVNDAEKPSERKTHVAELVREQKRDGNREDNNDGRKPCKA